LAAISSFAQPRQREEDEDTGDISAYLLKMLQQSLQSPYRANEVIREGLVDPDTDYPRLAEIAAEKTLPGMWETTKETAGDIGKVLEFALRPPSRESASEMLGMARKAKDVIPKVVDVVSEQPGEIADAITGGLKQSFYERGAGGVAGLEDVFPFGLAAGMAGKVPKLVKTLGAAKVGNKATGNYDLTLSGDELSTLAKAQFGRTDDPYTAGYILDDGDMLDFSGGVSDEPYFAGHTRNKDHREISSLETGAGDSALIDVRNDPGSAHGYMVDFMNRTNAVRISVSPSMGNKPPSVDFEFVGMPSRMQQVKMRKIMKQLNVDHAAFDLVDNEGRQIRSAAVDMPQGYHLEAFLDPDPDDLEDYGMTILDNMGDPMSREAIEALSTPEVSSDVPKLIQTVGSPSLKTAEDARIGRKFAGGFDRDVYHGSTFDIPEFTSENLNPEGHMGKGHYFTTSPEDASYNYADLSGPDVKGKLQMIEDAKATGEKATPVGPNQGTVYDISLAVKNPLYIDGPDQPRFKYDIEYDADGEIISEDEGTAGELLDAIFEVAKDNDLSGIKAVNDFNKYQSTERNIVNVDLLFDEDGLSAGEVDDALRRIPEFMDAEGDGGKLIGHDLVRQVYERLGYDSVIMDPKRAFSSMPNIPDGTEHIIVFPGYANRIRSQRAQFDPEKSHLSDIMATATPVGVGAAGGYAATREDK